MELNRKNVQKIILIVSSAILLFLAVQNLPAVMGFVGAFFRLLSPFLIGACIAFILNVPLHFFENKAFAILNKKSSKVWPKIRRPVCITITILCFLLALFFILFLLVPELVNTFGIIKNKLPPFLEQMQAWAQVNLPIAAEYLDDIELDWNKIAESASGFLQNGATSLLNTTVSVTTSIVSGVVNFILGLIFSFYILAQKEKLATQLKRVLYAFLPEKRAESFLSVCSLSNGIFSKFITGQCTEAVILGLLCFIGMNIFRLPYSPMIATLIGFTALIPIFGAFIGIIVGAFLILMVSPIKALWFIIFIVVLQQIEGNLIYPKVVGSSVGLPGIWVLFAVTIGGSAFGIAGMLVGVPLCSVLYCLFRQAVSAQLEKKKISRLG